MYRSQGLLVGLLIVTTVGEKIKKIYIWKGTYGEHTYFIYTDFDLGYYSGMISIVLYRLGPSEQSEGGTIHMISFRISEFYLRLEIS